MERYEFERWYTFSPELEARLNALESQGKSHLEALELILLESNERMNSEPHGRGTETDAYRELERTNTSLSAYIKKRKWFEEIGSVPREKDTEYDFHRIRELAKQLPTLEAQIDFWELTLKEFISFAQYSPYMPDPFRDAAQAELKTLSAAIAFSKRISKKKLVWDGKPSEFGHLLSELYSKGWIGLQGGGELGYSEFARVCLEVFEFTQGTTEGTLAKQLNPNSNQLPDDIRERFKIPYQSEMNPKRVKKK